MDEKIMSRIFCQEEQEELIKRGYKNYIPKSINLEERIKLDRKDCSFSMFTNDGEVLCEYQWKSWMNSISDEIEWSEGIFIESRYSVIFIGIDKKGHYYTCDMPFGIVWSNSSYQEIGLMLRLNLISQRMESLNLDDDMVMKIILAIQEGIKINIWQYPSYEEMKEEVKKMIKCEKMTVSSGFLPLWLFVVGLGNLRDLREFD